MVKLIHQSTLPNKGAWRYEKRLQYKLNGEITAHRVPVVRCPQCGLPKDCWDIEADGTLGKRFVCHDCRHIAYFELVDCEGVINL